MVNLIDTHSHIYATAFDTDRSAMLDAARKIGVSKIFMPNIDVESVEPMFALADSHPNFCFPMIGLHPCSVDADWETTLASILAWLPTKKCIAIGEIGIDLYWEKSTIQWQQTAFRKQVAFAIENNLPIVIHSRSATPEIMEILREFQGQKLRGVFHCFSEYFEFTEEIYSMGFYFGIGGVLTYKNSGLSEVVKNLSIDRIILETDAPYLAPAPFRGKRNEPAYVWHVAAKLAEIKGVSIEEIGTITSKNAESLFLV